MCLFINSNILVNFLKKFIIIKIIILGFININFYMYLYILYLNYMSFLVILII